MYSDFRSNLFRCFPPVSDVLDRPQRRGLHGIEVKVPGGGFKRAKSVLIRPRIVPKPATGQSAEALTGIKAGFGASDYSGGIPTS